MAERSYKTNNIENGPHPNETITVTITNSPDPNHPEEARKVAVVEPIYHVTRVMRGLSNLTLSETKCPGIGHGKGHILTKIDTTTPLKVYRNCNHLSSAINNNSTIHTPLIPNPNTILALNPNNRKRRCPNEFNSTDLEELYEGLEDVAMQLNSLKRQCKRVHRFLQAHLQAYQSKLNPVIVIDD